MRALKASLRPQTTARRDGVWQTLDAAGLVPGDLVLLASGSHVPADCRVRVFHVHDAASTGKTDKYSMQHGVYFYLLVTPAFVAFAAWEPA